MKNKKILKIIIAIIIIGILIGCIIYIAPIIKNLLSPEGRLVFKEKLDSLGFSKVLVLFALQLVQILLVFIPGEPLEILAGLCFGTFWGTIFVYISVGLVTALVFFLVRKYGRAYVEKVFKKEKIDKIENSKFFKNPKNIELVMLVLFLIPGTPKDLLVYLGGLLPIKPLRFILISVFARTPSIISSTLVGSSILNGDIITSIIIYAITFLIAFAIIFIVNKFDKNKITKEAMDAIK